MADKISASFPDWMLEEIETRRGDVPRSVWLQYAVQARLNAEDDDTWEPPEIDNRAVTDGGEDE